MTNLQKRKQSINYTTGIFSMADAACRLLEILKPPVWFVVGLLLVVTHILPSHPFPAQTDTVKMGFPFLPWKGSLLRSRRCLGGGGDSVEHTTS